MPNVSRKPVQTASAVPIPICAAIAVGRGADDASAQVAAAFSTSITPLGHAVSIQNQPSARITVAVRIPAIMAAVRLVRGS